MTLQEEKKMGMRQRILSLLTVILFVLTLSGISSTARAESNAEALERLERKIDEQQTEIDAQKEAIEKLKKQEETGSEKPAPEASPPDEAPMPQPISDQKPRAKPPAKPPEPKRVVETGQDKIKLLFYGQVNRAILYSIDGDKGYWYFVYNDNSFRGEIAYGPQSLQFFERENHLRAAHPDQRGIDGLPVPHVGNDGSPTLGHSMDFAFLHVVP